jgi:hypothetical protein
MRLNLEEAACQILETLQQRLPRASVEYESFGGTHYFYIDYLGLRLNVRFPEAALHGKNKTELASAIQEIVEQVTCLTRYAPRQFRSMLTLSFTEPTRPTLCRSAGERTLPIPSR